MDVFVEDEFFIWVPILQTRLALRLVAQLADVTCVALRCPSCGRPNVPCVMDVSCVCVADVRLGAQLADVPCIALGQPTLVRLY